MRDEKILTEVLKVRLSPELLTWLKGQAAENERTVSQEIRLAIVKLRQAREATA